MVEIDGAHGEGGGQLVRTAVALAAATGEPVRIVNIRARRRVPGLAAQHVAAVQAVAALCDADCEGVQLRSTTLAFTPRRLHGGDFRIEVGTAGSIALVLQALLPAAIACGQGVRAAIRGGTDVPAAPPMDYLRFVLLPLLARMGVQAELTVVRRGYYPKGGGEVRLDLQPVAGLQALQLPQAGPLQRIELLAHVARLPRHIAERMEKAARAGLPPAAPVHALIDVVGEEGAAGPGGAILLRALTGHTVLGAAQVAERGVPAERLGALAAAALTLDLQAGATLDVHAADQLPVFLALARSPSVFRASRLSTHADTALWLLQRLTPARFAVQRDATGVRVDVQP